MIRSQHRWTSHQKGQPAEIQNRTLVDQVATSLRLSILNGDIAPGERVKISDLSGRFRVSHIPIREALRRLESEGLVRHEPHRGATATGLELAGIAEVYDARRILESRIAERAIGRFSQKELPEIAGALHEMERASTVSDLNAFMQAHRRFHWLMLRPGATPLLEQILRKLWQTSERYVRFVLTVGQAMELAQAQHKRMYRFCKSGDKDAFVNQVLAHLDATEQIIHSTLEAALTRGQGAAVRRNSASDST